MNEPLTEKNIMHFTDGAYLTGDYVMPKRIKSAIEGLKDEFDDICFPPDDIKKLIDKWFPLFKEV